MSIGTKSISNDVNLMTVVNTENVVTTRTFKQRNGTVYRKQLYMKKLSFCTLPVYSI